MVFGTMSDKNPAESAALLFPLASRVLATTPSNARALPSEEIRDGAPPGIAVELTHTVAEAVERVRAEASPQDVVFFTGSLFVVGEARRLLAPGDYVE